jgi:GMP synthase (glutamine-hydrolysing)
MAILVLEHDSVDPISRLGDILNEQAHRLKIVRLHAGGELPPDLDNVDGLVVMGGRQNVDEQHLHAWMPGELELIRQAHGAFIPIVGICLGAQLIAAALGGEVGPMETAEIGWMPVKSSFPGTIDTLHAGVPWVTTQFHAHGYEVSKLPPDATPLSGSRLCKTQAFKVGLRTYAFQYHFEWTRRDIERLLRVSGDWVRDKGYDTDTIRQGLDEHYAMYRHLGDRLCYNLANLLFPIDKRLGVTLREVENFHAQIS